MNKAELRSLSAHTKRMPFGYRYRVWSRIGCVLGVLSGMMITPASLLAQESAASQPAAQDAQTLPAIRAGEELTLARVLEIARRRQPEIVAARKTIDAGQSRVGQARSGLFPQVDGSAGLSRFSPSGSISNPTSSDVGFSQYVAGITANQLLYDFGKTRTRVAIQETNVDSFRADLASVEDQIGLNAKLTFFDLLKAVRKRAVAEETVVQFEKHRLQAQGFYEAGVKPKYDVTKAEVDLSNAKLELIRAENGIRLGKVALNTAMGFTQTPDYTAEDMLDFEPFPVPLEEGLAKAYDNRPDLKALLLRKKAAEQAVHLAGKGDAPIVAGQAGATYGGTEFPLDEGWNVGVTLSVPLSNGNRTRFEVTEAEANLAVLAANEDSLRQGIYQEIQQGYLTLREAEERIGTSQLTVKQAEENFTIASGRYEAGVGNPVEVTDAEVLLATARTNHIEALYDYKIAQAAIEKAIGMTAAVPLRESKAVP